MIKRFLALILAVITVFSFSACDIEDASDETLTSDSDTDAVAEDGKLTTLAGKTPLEVYRAAEEYVTAMDNYELDMTYESNVKYNGTTMNSSTESIYRVNHDQLYYCYAEDGKTVSEHWCTGNFFYQNSALAKQRLGMTFEEYKKNRGVPTDGGLLVELKDSYFDGITFEKNDGGYTLSFEISVEDYEEYSGVTLTQPTPYVVYFDENANPTGMYMNTTQLVYGAFLVNGDMNVYIKNVGTTADIDAPSDAAEYRDVPLYENIDFSTLDDTSGVVESDNATDYVRIDVKDMGSIVIRLYPDVAPKTVANFKSLVSKGFYDGLTFHRVIENFMIQGGCPNGDGTGGADETIVGEFGSNGFMNNLLHKRGVVSMARSNDPDSASSQFFIMHAEATNLNDNYASFGYVIYGMDVVDDIAKVETDASNDKPLTDVVITSIKFVTVE